MADKFKCKGKHFPKKVGDEWVCMYCDEKVEDPNKLPTFKDRPPLNSLCDECLYMNKKYNLPIGVSVKPTHPFCSRYMTLVLRPVSECKYYKKDE